jgi:hypothetical protein
MLAVSRTYPAFLLEKSAMPALDNPAVAHCFEVWKTIQDLLRAEGHTHATSDYEAARAYRHALPPLTGYQNIRNFIACVNYGILIGAIKDPISTRLLYGARVALSAVDPQEKRSGSRPTQAPDASQTTDSSPTQ